MKQVVASRLNWKGQRGALLIYMGLAYPLPYLCQTDTEE